MCRPAGCRGETGNALLVLARSWERWQGVLVVVFRVESAARWILRPAKRNEFGRAANSLPTRAPARTPNLADHPHPSLGAGRAAGCLLTCSKPSTLYGPAVKTPFRRPFALPGPAPRPPHVLMIASHAGKRALDARPCWLPCTTKSRKTSASTCTSAATRASCGELTKLKSKPQRL